MKTGFLLALLAFVLPALTVAQVIVEGYVFESDNRGYLNEARVVVIEESTGEQIAEAYSDMQGFFTVDVPQERDFIAHIIKPLFHPLDVEFSTKDKDAGEKVFVRARLEREPGYVFDMTIAPFRASEDIAVEAITGARIEIYNNSTEEEVLSILSHPSPNFQFTFKKGNHYTILVRKEGYFTKRMEAYVNVNECILCFDGVGDVRPAVTDNLTAGHEMGTLLANIEMQPVILDEEIEIQNIYYDLNSALIKPEAAIELDKLLTILRDNPALIVELSSHTDSRGNDKYNLSLSQRRAEAAVDYLVVNGDIVPTRIVPKGYGETKLTNKCGNDVECTEEQHAVNRRTELKVIGILEENRLDNMGLAEIKEEERIQQLLREVQEGPVIEIAAGEELPDDIQMSLSEGEEEPKVQEIVQTDTLIPEEEQAGLVVEEEVSVQKAIPIPADFNGYKIQIHYSDSLLQPDHAIYANHKIINFERRPAGGYSYLLGAFDQVENAEQYLDETLREKYPDAFIVAFENGTRIAKP